MARDLGTLRMISFGSNNEDVVLMRAFSETSHGYFADVGAGHPVMGNIVKNLSEHLGWRGVHIEPSPGFAASLRLAYPADHVAETVVSDKEGDIKFFDIDEGWLSTADSYIAAAHSAAGRIVNTRTVHATTLDKVLEAANAPQRIDLLKIDVEGMESAVLAGFSFAKWSPRVILVEATEPMTPRRSTNGLREFLAAQGYRHTLFDGVNDFYVGPGEHDEFVEALSVQANFFDRFIPAIWYRRIDENKRPEVELTPRNMPGRAS